MLAPGKKEDNMANDNSWSDAQRLESWAGEMRINLIRAAALAAFYGHHLLNVFVISDDPTLKGRFHAAATGVVLVWSLGILLLHQCLSRRYVPWWLKYTSLAMDLGLPDVDADCDAHGAAQPAYAPLFPDHCDGTASAVLGIGVRRHFGIDGRGMAIGGIPILLPHRTE
jgi:hypothetical protein